MENIILRCFMWFVPLALIAASAWLLLANRKGANEKAKRNFWLGLGLTILWLGLFINFAWKHYH